VALASVGVVALICWLSIPKTPSGYGRPTLPANSGSMPVEVYSVGAQRIVYTENVTKEDAARLYDWLKAHHFYRGSEERGVRLSLSKEGYVVGFSLVDEVITEPIATTYGRAAQAMANELYGRPFHVQLVDPQNVLKLDIPVK
jgi:hypothetical protein